MPTDSLRTVVDELYTAMRDSGPTTCRCCSTRRSRSPRRPRDHLPQTTTLIDDGATVLRTQLDSSAAWRSFSRNAKLFATELASADGDLRELIGAAPAAATQLSRLLSDTNPGLSVLLANLLTTAEIFERAPRACEQLFVMTPKAVAATSTSITPDGGEPVDRADVLRRRRRASPATGPPPYRPGEDVDAAAVRHQGRVHAARTATGGWCAARSTRRTAACPTPAIPGGGARLPGPLGAPDLPGVAANLEELLWLTK